MEIQRENRFLFCIWLGLFLFLFFLRISGGRGDPASNDALEQERIAAAQPSAAPSEATPPPDREAGEEAEQEPVIRVLLTDSSQTGYFHQEVDFTCGSGARINGSEAVQAGEAVKVTADDSRFSEEKIEVEPEDPEAGIAVSSITRAQGTPVYQGTLEIYRTQQGLYLVNVLDLETYLKYVVPSEMPASYAMEALKAQAVCARTYACRAIEENALAEYHAHVDDSVSYQVYNNIERQETSDQAVDETAGQIMTWEGQPITAYFFSTSCGYTSTSEVWSGENGEGYLKSVYLGSDSPKDVQTEEVFASFIQTKDPDDYESEDGWYRWKVIIPAEVLDQRLEEYGIGALQDMTVLGRSSGGAVTKLQLTGTGGTALLTNEYAIREFLSVKGIAVTKNDGTRTTEMNLLPSAYFISSGVYDGGKLTGFQILGGGYGHGVGMSQNGAEHLAGQGYSWQEILNFFYKDIQLQQAEA